MLKKIITLLVILSMSIPCIVRAEESYVNVRDYGAVGNGIADDTEALQVAFDSAKEQGLPAYVPSGTYNYSYNLDIDGITVWGAGADNSILRGTRYNYQAIYMTGDMPKLYNIGIRGKNPMRNSDRGGNGIYIRYADGYEVVGCRIESSSGAAIMTENSSNGKILSNEVLQSGADGIYTTEGTYNVEIAYNKVYNTGDDGISVTSYASGTDEKKLVRDVNIHHNMVTGNTTCRSITVNGCTNINIYNNYITDGTCGISVGATTSWNSRQNNNIKVYNNIIKNTLKINSTGTVGGGALHLYNDQSGTDTGIEFYNNDIVSPGMYGIYVWGTNDISAKLYNNNFYTGGAYDTYKNDNSGAVSITLTNNNTYTVDEYDGDDFFVTAGIDDVKTMPYTENKDIYNLGKQNVLEYEGNSMGVWSFYATGGYYPVKTITSAGYPSASGNIKGSGIKYDEYKYGKLSDEKYYIPVSPKWYSKGDILGVYFGYDGGYQRSHIFIPTVNKDGMVRFYLDAPNNTFYKTAGDMAVCFTAPADGYYDLESTFENRGTGHTDGGRGMVRITIVKDGNVMETEENSLDTMFGKFIDGEAEPLYINKSEYLSKDDKVFIRVSAYDDSYNDDFWSKIIFRRLNEKGEELESYDLSDVGMSKSGQFEFFNAPSDEKNTDNYIKMYAEGEGPMSGHAADPIYTNSNYKNMHSTPNISWDASENTDRVSFKNRKNDAIVSWTAPESGSYTLRLNAIRRMRGLYGGNLIVSVVKKGENADNTVIGTLNVPNAITEKTSAIRRWLEEGDRLYIRAHSDTNNEQMRVESSVVIEKNDVLDINYYKNGEEISSREEFTSGSEIEAQIALNNYNDVYIRGYVIIALYSEDGTLLDVNNTSRITVSANSMKETSLKFTVPSHEGNIRIKAFAWDSLDTLSPLTTSIE